MILGISKNHTFAAMFDENIFYAFGLTLFAGLSTGIGSAIGLFAKKTNYKLLSFAMGFSAGVMIYISFTELLGEAFNSLQESMGEKLGSWIAILSFFGGIGLIALIDKLVPEHENPHEFDHTDDLGKPEDEILETKKHKKLLRTGLFTALAIAIHNFPEGMATFAGALKDLSLGIPIAIAIAIHNIPEGLAVSVPIYYATGNRKRAFWYSFFSGLAEPLGAIVGYFLFLQFFNDTIFGIVYASIAGIMVFIALDQLLPAAEEYGSHHVTIYGLVSGMAVMAVSLVLFL
jgi:ZIP family zinc transporter